MNPLAVLRILVAVAVGNALAAAPAPADAQAPPQVRIGWLMPGRIPWLEPFRERLRELGWVEGRNAVIEERYGDTARPESYAELVADLVRLKVDVFVTAATIPTEAARGASRPTPVVFASAEPVEKGWVASLARPGGNLTGIATANEVLNSKMLEVLREAFPRIRRVAVFLQATPRSRHMLKLLEPAARSLSVEMLPIEVGSGPDIDRAAATLSPQRVDAILALSNPFFDAEKRRLIDLAAKLRLPAVFEHRAFADAGGLLSYGPDLREVFRRMADQVDRILRGARPSDIPVEQPTRFELAVNVRTARTLGLTVPPSILARADHVIE